MTLRTAAHAALSLALTTALTAPALAQETPEPGPKVSADDVAGPVNWNPADWDLEDSEFTPEAGWYFGKLDNGVRYIIRPNNRPEGTALVRMVIGAGSIDEQDDEQGFAHYVEHMAFNGSTNIPEGEMIKLLEREGLAFGADTNASTGFDETQYKLDLPRNDEALLDTALMLMRETVSELTITPEAVARERGVILSERRVRNGYAFKNTVDGLKFAYPDARISKRLPIGILETLEGATAEGLRGFWEREYVPQDTVLIVVGDFQPALVEQKIQARFADWRSKVSVDQPDHGPVDLTQKGQTDIYLDPALTESITLIRHGAYIDRPDTVAERRQGTLRRIGQSIINRRLQRLQRSEDPPFRGVNVSTSNFFKEARSTQVSVSTVEGQWQRGLDAAIDEYRRALIYGFTEAEIAEQISNGRTSLENAIANKGTRSNATFTSRAFTIANGDLVPDSPEAGLARFNAVAELASPQAVLAALRENVVDLEKPLIRFTGKSAPEGGSGALRAAVEAAFAREVTPPEDNGIAEFAYTDFGTPGTVVEDGEIQDFGIRTLRFANGVRVNLKPTDLQDNVVSIRMHVDGGRMLRTAEDPQAVTIASLLTRGGLGKHSTDELQSILAGKSVRGNFGDSAETFLSSATTTPKDFRLQMQLLTAFLADPGYRPEGLGSWYNGLDDFFGRLGKTPGSAYSEASNRILSDGDPRFTRPAIEQYRALNYERLRTTISDRLQNGAIEVSIVGDFEEDAVIAVLAETIGALPQREAEFRPYDDERRDRSFTDNRGLKIIPHDGEADQALLRMVWPTDDAEDVKQATAFTVLARITRLMLTEKLREELGQTYSPSVSDNQSRVFRDYGTFAMGAAVDVTQLDATKAALVDVLTELRSEAPDEDLMQRARQPLLEAIDNRLKSNRSWMSLVDRAQSETEDVERFRTARERYTAVTGAEILALARQYLALEEAVEFRVVPRALAEQMATSER